MNSDRLQQWDGEVMKTKLYQLPPRIQQDIRTIPFPQIDTVSSTYLWGEIGSGKTIRAVFMMLTALRDSYLQRIHLSALYITVPELLLKLKNSYSQSYGGDDPSELSEMQLVERYSEVDLLVLDDFGVERTTEWSFQLLYIIINRRYENMKKTIFTSNLDLKQLAEKLGDDRIPSRIQQMCQVVQLTGKNYRERL